VVDEQDQQDQPRAAGQDYVTQTNSSQCPGAPDGPGGLGIFRVTTSQSLIPVTVPGVTGNRNRVVGTSKGQLLVLAQAACPDTSSLLLVNPATGAARVLERGAAGQAGVLAAIPYGS
jgi:hypothetical protein